MEQEILKKYKEAGKIAKIVREEGKKLIKPGIKLIEIAETIENRIRELGALPAWPLNISINEIAAHYSPAQGDDTIIKENDLVKLDIGVAIDGYIADTACTIALSEKDKILVEAVEKALDGAIKLVKPGRDVNDIATRIEEIINSFGLKPITNLTGHGLERYIVHAEPKIPNYNSGYHYELKENEVIAIEPFATYGRNFIKEEDEKRALTYSLIQERPCRLREAREIMEKMKERQGMPFSDRWLNIKGIKLKLALKELIERNCIEVYRILKGDAKISHAEHTIIVLDKPIVITL
jgi:methionyl aminopeptidase